MTMAPSSEYANLSLISAIAFVAISPLYFFGALSVQITQDLEYRPSLHGFGSTSFYLIAVIFAVAIGRKADFADPVMTLKLSMVITFLSSIGIAFAQTLGTICLFLAIGGLANALATPGIAKFVQNRFEAKRHGLAYGFKQSATGLSTLIGAAAIPFVTSNGEWRIVFALGSLFSLAVFFILSRIPSDKKNDTNFRVLLTTNSIPQHIKVKYSIEVRCIAVSFALGAAVGVGLITYLPLSNSEVGLNAEQSSFIIVSASLGSLLTRFIVLFYMDKTEIDSIKICIIMMAIGSIGLFGMSMMEESLIAVASFLSYAFGWGWIGLITYKMLRISDGNLGANVGLMQSAAAIGSISGPIALAAAYEASGFRLMWQISSVALIASFLFLVVSQLVKK
jgi:MFS family permease